MTGNMKFWVVIFLILGLSVSGCSIILQKRSPKDLNKIDNLSAELKRAKAAERELLKAKEELEQQLKREIEEKQISLEIVNKGLVITFVAEVLFDSGKAQIRKGAYPVLNKVADVLNNRVANRNVAVEGHTDNQPIQRSNWKSNWELSTARSVSVLHYLVDEKDVKPERLSAVGYGEFRPIASNETTTGRQQNRRVEITILPEKIIKQKEGEEIK